MGSGAAGHRREPAAVVHRRRAWADPRQRRLETARDDEGSAVAAHGSIAPGRRRAAVHVRDLDRRRAGVRIDPGVEGLATGAARRDARIVRQHRRPVCAPAPERARRRRSRARAGAARRRRVDDAQFHEAAAGESGIRFDQPRCRSRAVADDEVSTRQPGALLRGRARAGEARARHHQRIRGLGDAAARRRRRRRAAIQRRRAAAARHRRSPTPTSASSRPDTSRR